MDDFSLQNSKAPRPVFSFKRALTLISFAFCLPAVALTLLAFGARWWWPLELCTHFRLHYVLVLAAGTVVFVGAGRRKTAAVFGLFALFNGLPIAMLYWPRSRADEPGRAMRFVVANVLRENTDAHRFEQMIGKASPDVVLILELTREWQTATQFLDEAYPFHVSRPREDSFGIGLWSRHQPLQLELTEIGPAEVPSIFASFDESEIGPMFVIGTHTLPPINREYAALRNEQLRSIGRFVAQLSEPIIVMGDLNTTSWSPFFRDLLTASKLRDSRMGYGNQATWPSPLGPLGIAIDHVLISPDIKVTERKVGPRIGSDHRPVIIDVVLSPRSGIGDMREKSVTH